MLGDAGNDCWVSSESVWEIAIRSALGKFRGDFSLDQLEQGIDEAGLLPLDVTMRYAAAIAKVAVPYGDPFDRLLAAQCEVETPRLLTADEVLARLPVAIKAQREGGAQAHLPKADAIVARYDSEPSRDHLICRRRAVAHNCCQSCAC